MVPIFNSNNVYLMFTQQLNFYSCKELTSPLSPCSSQKRFDSPIMDLQYQLCSSLIKFTGDKYAFKQMEIMQSSKRLMQQVGTITKTKLESSKTLDTECIDGWESQSVWTMSERDGYGDDRKKQGMLSPRKNNQFVDAMLEIQNSCSEGCYQFISNTMLEYKKLQAKIKHIENKESKSNNMNNRYHEQNLLLKRKLDNQQKINTDLHSEISKLKHKNKLILDCINQKISSATQNQKYIDINNKIYKDIKNYLHQKQKLILTKNNKIQQIQNRIINMISEVFSEDKCVKCCDILKRLKESILRFKVYLDQESKQMEKFYQGYKKNMYTVKKHCS